MDFELTEEQKKFRREVSEFLDKEVTEEALTCPLCGGDTFRFLGHGQVRCMLCSNSGDYEWQDNELRCNITSREHHLFLAYEDARKHPDLLRAMKKDFLARREELKAMIQQYDQEGTWIQLKKHSNL
jgi:hypothetical protein